MKLFLLYTLLFSGTLRAAAQYDNVWVFGDSAGIDFNSNPPKPIKTNINTKEGCASISNEKGQLLFYSDGTTIWDSNHTPMPNGKDLTGRWVNITYSTSQATMIVPIPGKTKKYYVFSLACLESGKLGSLYYCIVDMALNQGKGDVLPDMKSKKLATDLEEAMTAVPGNECNIWLITSSNSQIKSYNIDLDGIDTTPTLSSKIANNNGNGIGCIDISPDRRRLALAQEGSSLTLYDFDVATGKASNGLILDAGPYYGVSFSPDNSKLYATRGRVLQYDLGLVNAQSIIESKVDIGGGAYSIRRAIDGYIYVTSGTFLSVIHHPNLQGASCKYVYNGFNLDKGSTIFGLPNPSTTFAYSREYSSIIDTVDCVDSFLLSGRNTGGSNYKWEDGTEGLNRYIYKSGIYSLNYHVWNGSSCQEHIEEFHVTLYNIPKHYTTTTFSGRCQADTFTMTASNTNLNHYLWEDNITTGKTRKINMTGLYWLSYRNDSVCEHYVDSFLVSYPLKDYSVSFLADTLVCENDVITFTNTSDPHFNSFSWHWGNGDSSVRVAPEYRYREAGSYTVTLTGTIDGFCPDTAIQTIVVDAPTPVAFTLAPDSICAGQAITLHHVMKGPTLSSLHWDFGDGNTLSSRQEMLQHAYTLSGARALTLKAVFRACPESIFTDSVFVSDLPRVYLGADTSFCLFAAPIYIKNTAPNPQEPVHYLWSTGDTTETISIKYPGTYSLQVRSGLLSCSTTEAVNITKNCYLDIPNAFTPNDDGINDFFFPRQLLSDDISRFRMQIHNRWGQILFESNALNGRGWDGRFHGQIQPQGVYIYSIEVERKNHSAEAYQGNVTLIR